MTDPQHDPQHDTKSPRQRRWLIAEHHIQTIGVGLITAALIGVGITLRSMYDAMIESRITELALAADVRALSARLDKVPTQREIDARFDGLGRRIEALERRQ